MQRQPTRHVRSMMGWKKNTVQRFMCRPSPHPTPRINRNRHAAGRRLGRDRPLRDLNGRLVRIEARDDSSLLQGSDVRTDGVREKIPPVRASSSSIARLHTLRPLDNLGVAHLVEKYVRCVKLKDGVEAETRLPEVFCQGLNTLAANQSRVPTCKGVQATPLVVNGKLVTADGFEPTSGLFFTSDPDLEAALPKTAAL